MDGENTASRVRRIEGKVDSISERVDGVENTCAIILHTVRSLDILLRKDRENGGSNNDDDTYQNPATSFCIGKKSSLPFPSNEKPQFATTGHKTKVKHEEDYFSWAYKPYMSEYRRGKGKEDDTIVTNNPNIRTKLFMTPAVETSQEKVFDEGKQPVISIGKAKQAMHLSEDANNNEEDNDDSWEHLSILPGLTLPKEIKTKFPTKKSMRLDEFKLRVCAFVFHPDKDPR
ncbi:ABC transporter substrate-binding protein [Sesbania bispinosa]|nr:ABC transporter substrate-binding protein [Sesbania bispinosa]